MPGPVVYVAVAIGTFAAVIAFKEFIYEPHIAPKVEAWAEEFIERRRRQREQRRGPIAVPVSSNHGDENQSRSHDGKKRRSSDDTDAMSVELEDLVAKEVNEWRDNLPHEGTLRQRKTAGVLEESNVFIPYDPISPTQIIFDSSLPGSPKSPEEGPSTLSHRIYQKTSPVPIIHTPVPRLSRTLETQNKAETPIVLSPRLPTPVSNASPASSRAMSPLGANLDHSVSSMSSFTPAVIGPQSLQSIYGSPRISSVDTMSDAGRSGLHVQSVPPSRITSPFSDINAANSPGSSSTFASPLILSPGIGSDFELPSDSEDGMLSPSLRSGMFSPSVDHEDDPFEVGSVHESEFSWASVGRRTPEP